MVDHLGKSSCKILLFELWQVVRVAFGGRLDLARVDYNGLPSGLPFRHKNLLLVLADHYFFFEYLI